MKHIEKQQEPTVFTNWKTSGNDDWQPSYNVLSGQTKIIVKEALMDEQGYLCCYCERRLTDSDSHIEHFRPQSDSAVNPLDFNNILCSCQNELQKGEPRHCGNLKNNWFDEVLLISPLDPECASRFAYKGDGYIAPAVNADSAAVETIERLGLNIRKLIALRAKAIEPFLDESLSEKDMSMFIDVYLRKDEIGKFGEFWTTIKYLFGTGLD